jgi:hypothetical protein
MATEEAVPAKLARLLETLEPADRQEIVTWLLGSRWPQQQARLPRWSEPSGGEDPAEALRRRRQLANWLPTGEGSQLVTIRLPAEQHERLRAWCAEHNFTMAAVVRGLIERFLDEQGRGGTPGKAT